MGALCFTLARRTGYRIQPGHSKECMARRKRTWTRTGGNFVGVGALCLTTRRKDQRALSVRSAHLLRQQRSDLPPEPERALRVDYPSLAGRNAGQPQAGFCFRGIGNRGPRAAYTTWATVGGPGDTNAF